MTKYYKVEEVVERLQRILQHLRIRHKLTHVSSSNSYYLEVTYVMTKSLIRISDHHENNHKLPEYNVLVRYPMEPNTISLSKKRYYNEYQLKNLVIDIIRKGENPDGHEEMG